MDNLIDGTYFIEEIQYPVNDTYTTIDKDIEIYQEEFLKLLVGVQAYDNIDESEPNWNALINGGEYKFDYDGVEQTIPYKGLFDDTLKRSPIANYVFCNIIKNKITNQGTTGVTSVNNSNADRVTIVTPYTAAWNKMIDWYGYEHQDPFEPSIYNFIKYSDFEFEFLVFKELEKKYQYIDFNDFRKRHKRIS